MQILLTGAAGFLGSHISARLLRDGHQVIGLDDFSTGDRLNLTSLMDHPNFRIVEWDVRDPFKCDVDLILNFACPASPKHYQSDPVRTIETNFLGIINLLHLANEKGARLVQASTSEVYGDPAISPQTENYWGNVNPIGIRSCYDEGKRAAETLCFDYKRQYSLDARVIRIFNTYGPNMSEHDGRVVSNFIVQALRGLPISIYGDGTQSRSFCYVDDLVEGILKVAFAQNPLDTPVNLGNPVEYSMLELAQQIISTTGSRSKLDFLPLPADDPRHRCPDISLARTTFGWAPKVELQIGLEKTTSFFRNKLNL